MEAEGRARLGIAAHLARRRVRTDSVDLHSVDQTGHNNRLTSADARRCRRRLGYQLFVTADEKFLRRYPVVFVRSHYTFVPELKQLVFSARGRLGHRAGRQMFTKYPTARSLVLVMLP